MLSVQYSKVKKKNFKELIAFEILKYTLLVRFIG